MIERHSFLKDIEGIKERMSLYVSQAMIKAVAAARDQSICPKGSASGLTATRSLYIIFFPQWCLLNTFIAVID